MGSEGFKEVPLIEITIPCFEAVYSISPDFIIPAHPTGVIPLVVQPASKVTLINKDKTTKEIRRPRFLFCFTLNYCLPPVQLLWYRVITTLMERVTTRDAPYSQPDPFYYAVLFNRLKCILRTSWQVTTLGW
jgi:hypothetical protein